MIKSMRFFYAGRTDLLAVLKRNASRALPAKRGRVKLQQSCAWRAQLALMAAIEELAAQQAIIREYQLESAL
ncbi:MAG: hypothetical protein HQL14_02985 [Candidatus Omnitrophica bacterium]|nr:hypothetical protein [Candidatus Omnitrophota bacterium]